MVRIMAKMGRPTKFDPKMMGAIEAMLKLGATDQQVADMLGVTEATFNNWKKENENFFLSVKSAKEEADAKVEAALYKMATGFDYKAKKPMVVGDGGGEAHVEIVEYEETVLPNTTSMIFWLKNRQPAKWRDKQEMEHSGGIGVTIVDDIK